MVNTQKSVYFLLVLFSAIVFGAGIWSAGIITQGDESDYIRSSQEMYNSGDLLTPTLRGELRFTKPPLLYWMVISSYKVFGVSLFSSRLPLVLSSILLIVFIYKLGILLFDKEAALMSALLGVTTFGMVKFSKIVLMEIPLTLLLLMSSYYFIRFYKFGENRSLFLSALLIGLSALLKSPVYPLIFILIFLLFLLFDKSISKIFTKEALIALGIFTLVSAPWYLAMLQMHGSKFIDYYMNEHVEKFFVEKHYFFRVWTGLLLYLLPWSLFFIQSIIDIAKRALYRESSIKFLLIWIVLFLIILMFPNQKGHYYAIPLIPPCILLTGNTLANLKTSGKFWRAGTSFILSLATLVIIAGAIVLKEGNLAIYSITVCSLILSIFFLQKKENTKSAICFGFTMAIFYASILPSVAHPPVPVSEFENFYKEKRAVFTYRLSPVTFSDSLHIDVSELRDAESFKRSIEDGGLVIIRNEEYLLNSFEVKPLLKWKRWRRRVPVSEVVQSILDRKTEALKEEILLVGFL